MRKKVEFILLILFLMGLLVVSRNVGKHVSGGNVKQGENVVVLDPGHGGNDPGKVGINGTLEKEINLEIAKQTKKKLEKENIKVIMTRKNDVTLAKKTDTNKKVQDLKARVEIINDTRPALVVSIHQNSYHEESVHGAQVFYYTHSKDSEKTALCMQEALLSANQDNTRKAKPNDTYYLLKRTSAPIIIVECGFLSNREEADLLATKEYQEKMAGAIAGGIKSCMAP